MTSPFLLHLRFLLDFNHGYAPFKDCHLLTSCAGLVLACCKVYDVTPFMDDHPGGDEVLLAATKKDATNDFEDVGHSNPARDLMDKYCIGKIDASTLPVNRVFIQPEQAPYNPDKTSGFTSKILPFLVPVMILGLAFAARYYTRAE